MSLHMTSWCRIGRPGKAMEWGGWRNMDRDNETEYLTMPVPSGSVWSPNLPRSPALLEVPMLRSFLLPMAALASASVLACADHANLTDPARDAMPPFAGEVTRFEQPVVFFFGLGA